MKKVAEFKSKFAGGIGKNLQRVSLLAIFAIAVIFAAKASLAEESATAQTEGATLEVTELVVAGAVTNLTPSDIKDSFSADTSKIYCFSRIKVKEEATTVTHTWYYNDKNVFQISLNVRRAPGFRTYSSKNIMPHQKGSWRVDVSDAQGTVLKSVSFTVN